MPQYFYHLIFELYPYCDDSRLANDQQDPKTIDRIGKSPHLNDTWLPAEGADIFDSTTWPRHSPVDSTPVKASSVGKGRLPKKLENLDTSRSALAGGTVVIDCGTLRAENHQVEEGSGGLLQPITTTTDISFPPPSPGILQHDFESAKKDWRFGRVWLQSWDTVPRLGSDIMTSHSARPGLARQRGESSSALNALSNETLQSSGINAGLTTGGAGKVTKARFEEGKHTEIGWGIVHLYRDGEETIGQRRPRDVEVYDSSSALQTEGYAHAVDDISDPSQNTDEHDYTTLCIPAVPSYLTPSDFLGFIGEKTREQVSHFRMVMTGRMNRYLVLMKFRDGEAAKRWKKEWDGKVFNSMEPETCHVMFIKSITFQNPSSALSTDATNTSFPALAHDPFTPSSTHLKPFPPPTPSLIELPTCPVCLERMDDTTGLLTILCQHVFHCSCLEKWRGSGCPVCRHTNASTLVSPSLDPTEPPFGSSEASLCSVCDSSDDLWICLICGNVGCGRYKGGHAKEHWKDTAHCFALEIETQHVWDYAGDVWVHRLIRDKGNGKVVELPSSSCGENLDVDMVPREKLERIGMEYTHLLTSQLESQRVYFEELVTKAVSKAEQASSSAAVATSRAEEALAKLQILESENSKLRNETITDLEKDLARERKKSERSAELARGFGKSLMEEKKVSEGLLKRIEHVNTAMMGISKEVGALREENEDLKDQNRDLLFSITAGEKIKALDGAEGLEEGEVEGGTVGVVDKKKGRRKR